MPPSQPPLNTGTAELKVTFSSQHPCYQISVGSEMILLVPRAPPLGAVPAVVTFFGPCPLLTHNQPGLTCSLSVLLFASLLSTLPALCRRSDTAVTVTTAGLSSCGPCFWKNPFLITSSLTPSSRSHLFSGKVFGEPAREPSLL